MKLYIRNVLSIRCKMMVREELKKLGLYNIKVELGSVEIKEPVSERQYQQFIIALSQLELALVDDKRCILVEKTKNIIVELIYYSDDPLNINLSDYLGKKLLCDYSYLAGLFSELEGITIQKFIISQKIKLAKELIANDGLNLTEIAYKLHYSSAAHFSSQFKKFTGLTPTFFKQLNHERSSF